MISILDNRSLAWLAAERGGGGRQRWKETSGEGGKEQERAGKKRHVPYKNQKPRTVGSINNFQLSIKHEAGLSFHSSLFPGNLQDLCGWTNKCWTNRAIKSEILTLDL